MLTIIYLNTNKSKFTAFFLLYSKYEISVNELLLLFYDRPLKKNMKFFLRRSIWSTRCHSNTNVLFIYLIKVIVIMPNLKLIAIVMT